MIYLDYAGNTPVDCEVLEKFCEIEQSCIGNANAQNTAGRYALEKIEHSTNAISAYLNVKPTEIIYVSGASEANNLALKGVARASRHKGKHILSTVLEHPSVSGTLTALQEQGYEIEFVDIQKNGTIDLEHLSELIRPDTIMVSICLIDSELGTIQPIDEIADILKHYPNCYFHVDAAQAVGKIAVNCDNIDLMSIAPHKFYGLNGIGILIKKDYVNLEPLIHGGSSITSYRSGTPTVSLIASTEIALQRALDSIELNIGYVINLRKIIVNELKKYPLVRINSTDKSSPYILNLSVKGVKGEDFQKALDSRGVCVSVKSACSTKGTLSKPVYAVTRDKKNALSSFRISLSHLVTKEELEKFFEVFDCCYKELN